MIPEYEHDIPKDPRDLHTDEVRTFANPWDEPAATSSVPPPASSSIYPTPTSSATSTQNTYARSVATPYVSPATKPKKKRGVFIGSSAFALLIVMVVGGGMMAYGYFAERVSEGDLVQGSTSATSFLRPKQWQQLDKSSDTQAMFGNKLAKDDKSTAVLSVSARPSGNATVTTLSSTEVDQLRQEVDKQLNDEYMRKTFISPTTCKEISNVKKTIDKTTTATTLGIISIKLDCAMEEGNGTIFMRVLGGNDGNFHFVALMGSANAWGKNQAVFEKMLGSIQPRGAVTLSPPRIASL